MGALGSSGTGPRPSQKVGLHSVQHCCKSLIPFPALLILTCESWGVIPQCHTFLSSCCYAEASEEIQPPRAILHYEVGSLP